MLNLRYEDIRQAAINSQEIVSGTSITVEDSSLLYLILAVDGSNVTITDAETVPTTKRVVASGRDFIWPLIIRGGFKATSGAASYVTYCTMRVPEI